LALRQVFLASRQILRYRLRAMAVSQSQRRPYLHGDERRAQLLRAAAVLFSERNYDAVSTADVARAAGVARGLVHYYFGTKRDLYLEVVRGMFEVPDDLFATTPAGGGRDREPDLAVAVDRWLTMTKRNRGTWLALSESPSLGRDPELDAIVTEARDRMTDQLIALAWGPPSIAPAELRALMDGYGGYAGAITAGWLRRGRPARGTVHALLLQGLLALIDTALPKVQTTTQK
jgi:AcrR family transcriptional regulator